MKVTYDLLLVIIPVSFTVHQLWTGQVLAFDKSPDGVAFTQLLAPAPGATPGHQPQYCAAEAARCAVLSPLEMIYSSNDHAFVTTTIQHKTRPVGGSGDDSTHDWVAADDAWGTPRFVAWAEEHRLSIKHSLVASDVFGRQFAAAVSSMQGVLLAANGSIIGAPFERAPSTVITLRTLLEAADAPDLDADVPTSAGNSYREVGLVLSLRIAYGAKQICLLDA